MKALFTSHLPPHIAHAIPLLALDTQSHSAGIETALLALPGARISADASI